MKKVWFAFTCSCFLVLPVYAFGAEARIEPGSKIRVLVITGGHDFEREAFFKLFKDNPDISYQAAEHPNAYAKLKKENATNYDVLVLYDMQQDIPEEAKQDLVARLKEGKGLVALHHCLCSYQRWPEYAKIIGGRYYLEKTVVDGIEKPGSVYKHGMQFKVHVVDPTNPVTKGLTDYELHDETYNGFDVGRECQPLLRTDEPTSGSVIAWTKSYERARVVYIQSGHDHLAYENPSYQQLLRQAIAWVARRE